MNVVEMANFAKKYKRYVLRNELSNEESFEVIRSLFIFDKRRLKNFPKIIKTEFFGYGYHTDNWFYFEFIPYAGYVDDEYVSFIVSKNYCKFCVYYKFIDFMQFYLEHYSELKYVFTTQFNRDVSQLLLHKLKEMGLDKKILRVKNFWNYSGTLEQLTENTIEYFRIITKFNNKIKKL